jgi:putative membrane protein
MEAEIISEISEIKAKHDIRHSLAIDRTILANERTMLAYTRTSLTMLVPGITFIHFFADSIGLALLGGFFIPAGIITFLYGLRSFYQKKAIIKKDKEMLNEMLRGQYCKIE